MRSWVIFLLSVGCSDTSLLKGEDGLACGDGTIEQDGECVPEEHLKPTPVMTHQTTRARIPPRMAMRTVTTPG